MPTLVRFLTVLLVLAALVGAGMFYLANFVGPNTRQMTIRIPSGRLEAVPVVRPPAAVDEPEAAEPPVATGDEPPAGPGIE